MKPIEINFGGEALYLRDVERGEHGTAQLIVPLDSDMLSSGITYYECVVRRSNGESFKADERYPISAVTDGKLYIPLTSAISNSLYIRIQIEAYSVDSDSNIKLIAKTPVSQRIFFGESLTDDTLNDSQLAYAPLTHRHPNYREILDGRVIESVKEVNFGDKRYLRIAFHKDTENETTDFIDIPILSLSESSDETDGIGTVVELEGLGGGTGVGVSNITIREVPSVVPNSPTHIYALDFQLSDGLIKVVEFRVTDGKDGEDGSDGYTPVKGTDYFDGERGEQGDKGDKGEAGEKGEKGDKGDKGEAGEKGEKGDKGNDGKSAYEIWLENGNSGSERDFLNSLKGEGGTSGTKRVKDGLTIAVLGDSISTKKNQNAVELTVTLADVGKGLSAYLTQEDKDENLKIGDYTSVSADIGAEVSFTPAAADIGKTIGRALNYNPTTTKVWWEHLRDIGAAVIPVCWSGSSISSHESSSNIYKTSYAWHDSQIRKLGTRIPGTMKRKSPDIVIIYRGCNDMTHKPYSTLTPNYFDSLSWQYPNNDYDGESFGYKEALSLTIRKIREAYPNTKIVIATQNVFKRVTYTSFPTRNDKYTLPQLNQATREVAEFFGCPTIDFDRDGITFENCYSGGYITDSETIPTHPNSLGHSLMAKQAIKDLDTKLDLFNIEPLVYEDSGEEPPTVTEYTISKTLTNVSISNPDEAVTAGESYEAQLTANEGYVLSNVSVTMGGVAQTVTDGHIQISSVTGNIVIVASAIAEEPERVYHSVTNNLTNVTSTNANTVAEQGTAYSAVLTANTGYTLEAVTVTMGGEDITANAVNGNKITVSAVIGDIIITAVAAEAETNEWAVTQSLFNVESDNPNTAVAKNGTYNVSLTPSDGTSSIQTLKVMMGETDITNDEVMVTVDGLEVTVSISRVTGPLTITAIIRKTANSKASPIPEGATSETNIFAVFKTASLLKNGYYQAASQNYYNTAVARSVIIPVVPGDKIRASSFQSYPDNLNQVSSASGTRVGFLNNDTFVESRTAADVNSEYNSFGYITVPEGANCAAVPFFNNASNSFNNWLYIDTL